MSVIDEKIVQMTFENKNFQKGTEESIASLERLNGAFGKLDPSVANSRLDDFADAVRVKFDAIEVAVQTVISRLTNNIFDFVGNITSKINEVTFDPIIQGYNKYESQISSVQTMVTATGKSIDTVTEQLDKLMWYADETSYSYTQMSDSVSKFVSAGVDLDDAVTSLIGIANWAGAAGANASEASRAMYNLAQAMGSGAVTMQDWKSIELANMATSDFKETLIETGKEFAKWSDIYSSIISSYGKDSNEFANAVEKNGHTIEEALKYVEYAGNAPKDVGWEGITAGNLGSTLASKWLTSDVLVATLQKYGNYTEDLYRIYNEGDFDTANDAIEAYHDQYESFVDDLYTIYKKFGKNSTEFRDYLNKNTIAMQTALDLVSAREAAIYNRNLESISENFKNIAETYGTESKQLLDAATEAGFSLDEATDIIQNGIENYTKVEMARGEQGFRNAQEAKTWTEAWDSAIEAASSQWLNFWETVVGNYEEAKVIWTTVANTLWDIFAGPLANLNEIADVWAELEGRTALLESIENIWNAIERALEPIKNAFADVSPILGNYEKLGEIVYNLTQELKNFTASLSISTETFIYLRVIAEGIFTVFSFVINGLKNIAISFHKVVASILPEGQSILAFIAELALKLIGLKEYSDDLGQFFGKFTGQITARIQEIKPIVGDVLANIWVQLSSFAGKLIEKITGVLNIIRASAMVLFGDNARPSGLLESLSYLENSGLYNGLIRISEAISTLKSSISTLFIQFKNIDLTPIRSLFAKIQPYINGFITTVLKGLLFVTETAINIVNVFVRLGARLAGFKGVWDNTIKPMAEGLSLFDAIGNPIKALFDRLGPVLSNIIEVIKRIVTYVLDAISKIDLLKTVFMAVVFQIASLGTSAVTVLKDDLWMVITQLKAGFVNFLGEIPRRAQGVVGFVEDILREISNTLNEIPYLESVANLLKSIGISLMMIAGSAVLFSSIPNPGAFVQSIVLLIGSMAGLYYIVKDLSKIHMPESPQSGGGIIDILSSFLGGGGFSTNLQLSGISSMMIAFGAALFLISSAALNLSKIINDSEYPFETLTMAIGGLGSMVLMLYLFLKGFSDIIDTPPAILQIGEKYNKAFTKRFDSIIKLLRAIVIPLITMTLIVKVLSDMEIQALGKGLFAVAAEMAFLWASVEGFGRVANNMALSGSQFEMSKGYTGFIKINSNMKIIASSLLAIAASIALISIPVKILGNMDLQEWGLGLGGVATIMASLFLMVKGLSIVANKMTSPVTTLTKSGFTTMGSSFKTVAGSLITIALSAALMAIPFVAIGKLNWEGFLRGALGITVILAELFGVVTGISKLLKGADVKILAVSVVSMIGLATAVGALGLAMIAIGKLLNPEEFAIGMIGLTAILSELTLAIIGIGLVAEIITPDTATKILALAGTMAIIGFAIDEIALAVIGLAKLGSSLGTGILGLVGTLSTVILTVVALGAVTVEGTTLFTIGAGMAVIGLGLNVIALAVKQFSTMTFWEILGSLAGLAITMVTIGVLAGALAGLSPAMIAFGLGMASVGAGMWLVGEGVDAIHTALFNIVDDPYVQDFISFLKDSIGPIIEGIIDAIGKLVNALADAGKKWWEFWKDIGSGQYKMSHGQYWDYKTQEWKEGEAPKLRDWYSWEDDQVPGRIILEDMETGERFYDAGVENGIHYGIGVDDGVKQALEIASPSKVMERNGEYAREGFEQGVGDLSEIGNNGASEYNEAFRNGLGISSPAQEMIRNGQYVLDGFKKGTDGFGDIAKTDAELYKEIFGNDFSNENNVVFKRCGDKVVAEFKKASNQGFKDAGKEDGKAYSEAFAQSVQDFLPRGVDLADYNFSKYGAMVTVGDIGQLGTAYGHQYLIGKSGAITALGEWNGSGFTAGSYLSGLLEASMHDKRANDILDQFVIRDINGRIIGALSDYKTQGNIQAQWDAFLKAKEDAIKSQNITTAKTGILGWLEGLGISDGIKGWMSDKAASFAEKMGLSGASSDEIIKQFQTSYGAKFDPKDTTGFEKALDDVISGLGESTDATNTQTDAANILNKAYGGLTKGTNSLSAATSKLSDYQSKLNQDTTKLNAALEKLKANTKDNETNLKSFKDVYTQVVEETLGDTSTFYTAGQANGEALTEGIKDGVKEGLTELDIGQMIKDNNVVVAANKYGVNSEQFIKALSLEDRENVLAMSEQERIKFVTDARKRLDEADKLIGDQKLDPSKYKKTQAIVKAYAEGGINSSSLNTALSEYLKTENMTRDEAIELLKQYNSDGMLAKKYTEEELKKIEDDKSLTASDIIKKTVSRMTKVAKQNAVSEAADYVIAYDTNLEKNSKNISKAYKATTGDKSKNNQVLNMFFTKETDAKDMQSIAETAGDMVENAEAEEKFALESEGDKTRKSFRESVDYAGKIVYKILNPYMEVMRDSSENGYKLWSSWDTIFSSSWISKDSLIKEALTKGLWSKDFKYIMKQQGWDTTTDVINALKEIITPEDIVKIAQTYGADSKEFTRLMEWFGYTTAEQQKEFKKNVQDAASMQAVVDNDKKLLESQNKNKNDQKKSETTIKDTSRTTTTSKQKSKDTSVSNSTMTAATETASEMTQNIATDVDASNSRINDIYTIVSDINTKLISIETIATNSSNILSGLTNANGYLSGTICKRVNELSVLTGRQLNELSGIRESVNRIPATRDVYLDGKTLVGKLAPEFNAKLGKMAKQAMRG